MWLAPLGIEERVNPEDEKEIRVFFVTAPFSEPIDAAFGQATLQWNNITATSPPDPNSAR